MEIIGGNFMNLEFLNEFIVPVILGICLIVGYIVKKWLPDVDNKFIPTIVAVLGVVISVWVNSFTFTPEIVLQGLASGLASTGLYELVNQLFFKNKEN